MPDVQFFQTAMGRTFFDHTMPTLVKELKRLNENMEALAATMKETKVDYAKVAQAIMDSPVKIEPVRSVGVPLQEKSDAEP